MRDGVDVNLSLEQILGLFSVRLVIFLPNLDRFFQLQDLI